MYKIPIIDYPYQTQTVTLFNGNDMQITVRFAPLQTCWYIESLIYLDFTLKGLKITNQPDMLYQYKSQLPFGLGCFSAQDREPSFQNDFSSDASSLYILDTDEVAQYEGVLSGAS